MTDIVRRPLELILGSEHYGPEIDMWSIGCIFAELLVGRAIFPGKSLIYRISYERLIC